MKLLYFLKSFLKITQQLPALVKSSTRMSISSSIWAMIPNKVAKVAANAPIDTSTKGFTLKFKWGGDIHVIHCIAGAGHNVKSQTTSNSYIDFFLKNQNKNKIDIV